VAFTGLPFLHVAAMPNLDMDDQLSLDAQGWAGHPDWSWYPSAKCKDS
jgi:hypothetical protein